LSYYVYVIHGNIKVDFGWWSWALTSPCYHRLHHSSLPEHYNRNYAFILPIYDVIFGSYGRAKPGEWPKVGLGEGQEPRGVVELIVWPVRGLVSRVAPNALLPFGSRSRARAGYILKSLAARR